MRSRRKGKALHEEHPMHDLIRVSQPLELGKYKLGGCTLRVNGSTAKTCRIKVVSSDLVEQIPSFNFLEQLTLTFTLAL